jgi:hypothetical protein
MMGNGTVELRVLGELKEIGASENSGRLFAQLIDPLQTIIGSQFIEHQPHCEHNDSRRKN